MAVGGGAPIFDEHVGVRLEERDELLVCRYRFTVEHAPRGLVDHLRDARDERGEVSAQTIARGRWGKTLEMLERAGDGDARAPPGVRRRLAQLARSARGR